MSHNAPVRNPLDLSMGRLKGHVLIVDDNRALVAMYAIILSNRGWAVTCAGTIDETLSYIANKQLCDLILLDYMLGDTNTERLAEILRSHYPAALIISMTGDSAYRKRIEQLTTKSLVNAMLQKPFRVRDLESFLTEAGRRRE